MDLVYKCLVVVLLALCAFSFVHVSAYYINGNSAPRQVVID